MADPLHIDIITLFPDMLSGFLNESMMKRAQNMGAVTFNLVQLRAFTDDVHHTTDDRPFGGGPGMVLKPEPIYKAITSLKREDSHVIFMTPQGTPFKQTKAQALSSKSHLIIVCGHYEGIDQRIRETLIDEEISIGDYVLTNGALSATVVVDATVRLIPGVLGGEGGTESESFTENLLDFPQYTRPAEFMGQKIPDILLSGDHAAIAKWRHEQALKLTRKNRPDLLE